MPADIELVSPAPEREPILVTRREAIRRVALMMGGSALIGGSSLLTACEQYRARFGNPAEFSAEDVALLDEIAETILPETSTPGAKAAGVGPFMAMMVTDGYDADEQRIFREGMRALDEASEERHGASFLEATPEQRLALLEHIDQEQWRYMEGRRQAQLRRSLADVRDTTQAAGDAYLPDQRQENSPAGDANAAAGITADAPPHYFRMMKELALLGYFTSEIGYTQALRYEESPGRFEPCVPYVAGEKAWAPHA